MGFSVPRALTGALLLSILVGCNGRSRTSQNNESGLAGDGYISVVNLSAGAPESPVGSGLFPAPSNQSFVGLIRALGRIESDKKVRGVFVKLKGEKFAFAQAREIGETLARLRKKHPKIFCHTHEIDNATLWLLRRGCSDIWVSAAGSVDTVGIGAELSYLKGAFDKAGIKADMLAMGKYKSGGEALTRTGPTEDSLGNLQNTLSDLRSQWLKGVSEEAQDPPALRKQVEDGPWSPKKAEELGIVDFVGFEDEALDALKDVAGTHKTQIGFGSGMSQRKESPAAEIIRLLAGDGKRQGSRDHIAVVPAVGSITMSSSGLLGGGSGITAEAMTKTLRRLRRDDAVRAIVVRMDSPGGSPLASDLIWREMMLTREEKPVIVSIAGMSASGGYYIASGASTIVASPAAIVGSIGVFGGKIVLGGAFEKLGVNHHQVAASPEEGAEARAAHLSPLSEWDDATRERVRGTMRRIYDLFVERVAEGRNLPKDKVYSTAEGEIFLATVGKERGLIDELGGIEKALALAREQAKLPDNIPVTIEGAEESILEALLLGPDPTEGDVQAALRSYEQKKLERMSEWALGPHMTTLRPFAAAVAPLLDGEQVVAALPYAIELR